MNIRTIVTANKIITVACATAIFVLALLIRQTLTDRLFTYAGYLLAITLTLFPITFHHLSLWRSTRTTWVLVVIFLALVAANRYVLLQPQPQRLRVSNVESLDPSGVCGLNCTVIVEGAGTNEVSLGQQLIVYGDPRPKQDGEHANTPIAVLTVLGTDGGAVITQPVLVHEAMLYDTAKRIAPNFTVVPATKDTQFMTEFLAPAFGDGFVAPNNTIVLKQGITAQIGDQLYVLEANLRGPRVVDNTVKRGVLLTVTDVGQGGRTVHYDVVSGESPVVTTITQFVSIHSVRFTLSTDRVLSISYCLFAPHSWLSYRQIAPTMNDRVVYPTNGEDYGAAHECKRVRGIALDVHDEDVINIGIGVSATPPDRDRVDTQVYQVTFQDGKPSWTVDQDQLPTLVIPHDF